MTATAHALAGAVIAAKISNPFLAYPLSLGSHFLMDVVPHWDTGTDREEKTRTRFFLESALDVAVGIFLVLLLFGNYVNPLHLWLSVFFAQLPDWLTAPYLFLKLKVFPSFELYKIQSLLNLRAPFALGIATQVLLIVPLVYYSLPQPVQEVVTSALALLI